MVGRVVLAEGEFGGLCDRKVTGARQGKITLSYAMILITENKVVSKQSAGITKCGYGEGGYKQMWVEGCGDTSHGGCGGVWRGPWMKRTRQK